MKCKEELPRETRGRVPTTKMVKCYECDGNGRTQGMHSEYLCFTGIVNWMSPKVCGSCQGFGQVPLYAQDQLCTIA